jgi:hypothetical protein
MGGDLIGKLKWYSIGKFHSCNSIVNCLGCQYPLSQEECNRHIKRVLRAYRVRLDLVRSCRLIKVLVIVISQL